MLNTLGSMVFRHSDQVGRQGVSPTTSAVESLLDRDVQARLAAELVEQARLAAELVEQAHAQGVDLLGPGGLLAGSTERLPAGLLIAARRARADGIPVSVLAHEDVIVARRSATR